jgi:hypothetical protein
MSERHAYLATFAVSLEVAILGALILVGGLVRGGTRGRVLAGGAVLGGGVVGGVRAWREDARMTRQAQGRACGREIVAVEPLLADDHLEPDRHPDRLGAPQPAQALQEAAQHLTGAGVHVERQGDGVADHHVRGQVPLALARPAGLGQDLSHLVEREGLGDHAEADVVAEADAGGQAGGGSGHAANPARDSRQCTAPTRLTERYCG